MGISTHALREEGDPCLIPLPRIGSNFYPRPPRGGRPDPDGTVESYRYISTHALREEGDSRLNRISTIN